MPRFSLSSLRARLLLLVALAIVPAGGVILYAGLEQRDQATLRAEADVQRLAHLAAAADGPLIEGARELLHTLVVLPQVQHGDARACTALLGDLLAQSPQYANLAVSRANGDVFCSALALPGPVTIADRDYFRQARADRTFAVGSYQIGRITGRAGLNFGMPVLTPAGTVAGVAFASLDLAWLNALAAQLELPPGATLTVLDRQGVILARRPDPGLWMGRSLSDATLLRVILARREGVGAATDLDGTPSLVAFAPLGAPAAPSEVFVTIGVPQARVVAAANRLLRRNLIWLGVVAVLALAVAWGGGELFLLRQVQALLAAARRLAAGDLRARSGLPAGSGELPQLARAFDDMAEALERRITGQEQAEGQLRRANRALRVLSECNQRMVLATTEAALLEAVCRILVETGGYRMAWVGVAEKDATKRVRPVAQFGDAGGYLAAVTISWADTDLGRGPTGTAIRTGAPSVAREILTDPRLAPWRAEALRHGYASLIAFPLTVDGAPWGALTIYAAEPDAFNTEEETLLVELADDLAYGIQALRTKKAHERALADIASLARFPGENPNPVLRVREDGTILYGNEASGPLLRLWGTAPGGPVPPEWGARVRRALETHAQEAVDLPCDGRIFAIVLAPIVEARYVNLYGRDVTERRRAEEALLVRTRQLEAVRAVTAEITRELGLSTVLQLVIRRAVELVGAPSGTLYVWDEPGQVLIPAAWHGVGDWMGEVRLKLGEGVAGTVAQRGAGMIVSDFAASPYCHAIFAERGHVSAVLAEPLRHGSRLLGVLTVAHQDRKGSFSEEDRTPLKLFADQAAIAIENARLYEATGRQIAELKALYDMGQAISSSLSLDEQLGLLVERVSQAMRAQRVLVGLLDAEDPGRFRLSFAYDASKADPWLRHLDLSPEGYPEIQEAMRMGRLLVIPEVVTEPLLAPVRHSLESLNLRSLVVVPLIVQERAIGAISLGFVGQSRTFTNEELNLLQTFTTQAAIAIEKARLFAAAEQRADELSILREIDHAITARLELPAVLEAVVAGAMQLLGAQHTQITIWDEANQRLRTGAAVGTEAERVRLQKFEPGEGINATVAVTRQPMILDDYKASPYALPEFPDVVATITVPVLFQNRLLGVLHSHTTEAGKRFTPDDLRRLQMIASQAAIAIENARLYGEALEKTERLEGLTRTSAKVAGTLRPEELLDAIVEEAAKLLRTEGAGIRLLEGDRLVVASRYGLAQYTTLAPSLRIGESLGGLVAQQGRPLMVPDQREDSQLLVEHRTAAVAHGAVAYLGVPVRYRDRVIGVLHVDGKERRTFSEEESRLLSVFADHAAIAIEQARLYATAVRRGEELAALLRATRTVIAGLDFQEILQRIAEEAGRIAGTPHVKVLLAEKGTRDLQLKAMTWGASGVSAGPQPPLRIGLSNLVAATGQPLFVSDCQHDPRNPYHDYDRELGHVTYLGLPIIVRDEVAGVLTFNTTERREYTPDDLAYLVSFADQAAIAIENARLYQEIRDYAAALEQRVEERTQELAAANQQLQDASRHKSEFLANMSHEIRTPLNSIIGFAELLREQGVGPLNEKQARYLTHIANGGKHLVQLIGDILDISKVEAGKFVLQPEPLPVKETLEDILVIARGLANKKAQEIRVEVAPDLPPLHADPVRFKQILFNLLSNAVKFTPEKGTITLTASKLESEQARRPISLPACQPAGLPAGDWLELRVTDTGIGIRPEDLPRLFQEFVQLETTQAQRHEGTGLGLALTKRLVELHGGRIWAESPGEGQGSTFMVVLPFAEAET